MTSWANSPRRK